MAGVISVMVIGNLGRDPEIRHTQGGEKIANLNIAVSESWKDKNSGEKKERTEWVRVSIFNSNIADIAERFLKKGSQVCITDGDLQTRKWTDKDGAERYTTEVIVSRFRGKMTLIGGAQQGGGQQQGSSGGGGSGYQAPPTADLADSIPF